MKMKQKNVGQNLENTSMSDMAEAWATRTRKRSMAAVLRRIQRLLTSFWFGLSLSQLYLSPPSDTQIRRFNAQFFLVADVTIQRIIRQTTCVVVASLHFFQTVEMDFYSWKKIHHLSRFVLSGNFRLEWKGNLKKKMKTRICNCLQIGGRWLHIVKISFVINAEQVVFFSAHNW